MMRTEVVALLLGATLIANKASAYDPYDPRNCIGVEWDDKRALVVSKVIAHPRVNFVKSPYDDDFKAEACPATTKACQKKSYLLTGELVLLGKTRDAYTCVTYQSRLEKKPIWTNGWLPSAALTPVAPETASKTSDWIGAWRHPGGGGGIEIKAGDGSKLHVEGGIDVPAGMSVQNGDFKADVTPQNGAIAFTDSGGYGEECHVRMQRIGALLLVEDNGGCGGWGVTFNGLYRRRK
jgi:hypothetical protein